MSSVSTTVTLEQAISALRQLPARERLRILIEEIADAEREIPAEADRPLKSLWGLWAKYGPAPSAADIDEARREMWSNFPREDI